ncbi:MAG: 30S ribosomal protein S16 [candidate division WS1 bacterium]|nr:30S ribosomal protein S16 [candidate division WS1 bacterium]
MATKIRLKRFGAKHDPHFRIVVSDSRRQRDGSAIEELGFYSPAGSSPSFEVNAERARHWLDLGAQPTDTVHALLVKAGVVEGVAGQSVEADAEVAPEAPAEETQ